MAWILAVIVGEQIFLAYMKEYANYQGMNHYDAVNPSMTVGKAVMDVGTIEFASGSRIDLTRSMTFQDRDTYCVAPIVANHDTPPTPRDRQELTIPKGPVLNFDFWAVGINCCWGESPGFACGIALGERPRSGLRVLGEKELKYYKHAVKQAVAEYQIKVDNPLFFYLTPAVEKMNPVETFRIQAHKYYIIGMIVHFGFQLFCVILAVGGFWKAGIMM